MAKSFGGGIRHIPSDFKNQITPQTGADEKAEVVFPPLEGSINDYKPSDLFETICSRGVGLVANTRQAESLTVNFAETDIGICTSALLAVTYPDRVVRGAAIIMKALGIRSCILAVPSDMEKCAKRLSKYSDRFSFMKIKTTAPQYPMYDPHCVISALYGVEINGAKNTADKKYMVVSPALCCAVYEALVLGFGPGKYVSVGGSSVKNAILVRLEPDEDIISAAEGIEGSVIFGGEIKGTPEKRETDGLLVMKKAAPKKVTTSCTRCGKCDLVCPMRLTPSMIHLYLSAGRYSGDLPLASCISCGCCSYVCPSGIDVRNEISDHLKNEILTEEDNDEKQD